jgi:hypothetical protein
VHGGAGDTEAAVRRAFSLGGMEELRARFDAEEARRRLHDG